MASMQGDNSLASLAALINYLKSIDALYAREIDLLDEADEEKGNPLFSVESSKALFKEMKKNKLEKTLLFPAIEIDNLIRGRFQEKDKKLIYIIYILYTLTTSFYKMNEEETLDETFNKILTWLGDIIEDFQKINIPSEMNIQYINWFNNKVFDNASFIIKETDYDIYNSLLDLLPELTNIACLTPKEKEKLKAKAVRNYSFHDFSYIDNNDRIKQYEQIDKNRASKYKKHLIRIVVINKCYRALSTIHKLLEEMVFVRKFEIIQIKALKANLRREGAFLLKALEKEKREIEKIERILGYKIEQPLPTVNQEESVISNIEEEPNFQTALDWFIENAPNYRLTTWERLLNPQNDVNTIKVNNDQQMIQTLLTLATPEDVQTAKTLIATDLCLACSNNYLLYENLFPQVIKDVEVHPSYQRQLYSTLFSIFYKKYEDQIITKKSSRHL